MSQNYQKDSQAGEKKEELAVYSNAHVVSQSSRVVRKEKNEGLKADEIAEKVSPLVVELIANAAKIAGKNIAELAGVVWDEWKQLSPFEKILTAIAAAIVVGAIAGTAVYGARQLIAGNWDLIKSVAKDAMKTLDENKEQLLKSLTSNMVVKKLQMPFEKELEVDPVMKIDDIKNITRMGYGNVISALLMAMPVFMGGAAAMASLADDEN